MRIAFKRILPLLFILLLLSSADISGKTKFGGVIGFDWQNYGFERIPKNLKDSLNYGRTDRTLLNHYLELSFSGDIAEGNFADYRLFGGFWGRFNQTSTNEYKNNSDYQFLKLNNYAGQFTFFPKRRYPLKLFHINTEDVNLEYEQGYRGSTKLKETGLATIRKYETNKTSTGAEMKYKFSEDLVFSSNYETQIDQRLRVYEFDENRDIWVDLRLDYSTQITTTAKVNFENNLQDDSVRIVLDVFDLLLGPGDTTTITIDTGTYTVDIIPLNKYKPLTLEARIDINMFWKIEFTSPPGSADSDLDRDKIYAQLKYEGEGKLSNTTILDASDESNFVTNAQTKKTNLSNLISYDFTRETDAQMKITYFKNENLVDNIPSQDLSKYEVNTIFNHLPRKGLESYVQHLYSTTTSITRGEEITNDVNDVESRLFYGFKRMNSRFGLKTNFTLQSNSKEEKSRELKNTLSNQFDFFFVGFKWTPYLEFINTKERGETVNSKEIKDTDGNVIGIDRNKLVENTTRNEFRIRLNNEIINIDRYGIITMTSEFYTQKQSDGTSSTSRKTYKTEVNAIKNLSTKLIFSFNTLQELQTADEGIEDERKSTYRFDLQSRLSQDYVFGGNIMFLSDPKTNETRYSMNVTALLPKIKIPYNSTLTYQDRTIFSTKSDDFGNLVENQIAQSNFTWENKIKTKIRKITIEFEHKYSKEKLTNNDYTFHEVVAKVKRVF